MNARIPFDPTAPTRPVNLRINSDLLEKAKALGINLSRELESHLTETVRERLAERWLDENREAFAAYNEFVEKNGLFSDGQRYF